MGKVIQLKRLVRVLILLVSLSAVCQAEEFLQIYLQLTEDRQEPQPVLVTLAGNILEFETMERRVRHNFKRRRSWVATEDAVEEFSLYADIGFRVAELQNRLHLTEALENAEIEAKDFSSSLLQLENLFGINAPDAPEPEVKEEKETVTYLDDDRTLISFSREGEKVSPEKAREFTRFLRYYSGGHPDGLARIQSEEFIPSSFVLIQHPVNTERVQEFKLVEVTTVSELQAFPKKTEEPESDLEKLLKKTESLSVKEIAERHSAVERRALEFLDSGEYFLATLSFLESTLNTGRPLAPEFEESRDKILEDKRVPLLLKAMRPREKTKVDASIKILESLKEAAGESAHVLTIFQGSLLLGAERSNEARALLQQALEMQPETPLTDS